MNILEQLEAKGLLTIDRSYNFVLDMTKKGHKTKYSVPLILMGFKRKKKFTITFLKRIR